MCAMRFAPGILVLATAVSLSGQTTSFQVHGFLSLRAIRVDSQPSWSEHGFGRFDVGGASASETRTVNLDVAQLGFDWTPSKWFLVHADGLARREPGGTVGKRAGLVQAYADIYNDQFRLRAGSFWLPTSRENVDALWTSRYTITTSALNSWIAQEVRPLGIDLQYSPGFYVSMGVTAFRDNDTMGTVLAQRGWSLGNRISVYDETIAVPAPDLRTRPIGPDLDDRSGFAGRIRVSLPERAMLQVTHVDNRAVIGTGQPPDDPWRTKFTIVGLEAGARSPNTVAAEWSSGDTTLGFPDGTYRLDFETAYVLLSRKQGADRYTVRLDRFSTRSHIHSPDDASRENGHAVTVAWLREFGPHLRGGLEYAKVKGERLQAALSGFDQQTGGSTITAELRLGF
jgi:hypothetical protein